MTMMHTRPTEGERQHSEAGSARPKQALPDWMPEVEQRPPHAKIIATLGPASDEPATIAHLVQAGVSVFRMNFSHGDRADHTARLERIRSITAQGGRPVAILGDLQGPKIRVGTVPDLHAGGGIVVEPGMDVWFRAGHGDAEIIDNAPVFGTTFDPIFNDVEPGQRVLINDGAVRMIAVDRNKGEWLQCRVVVGGRITSRKGINLPESDIRVPAITDRDWECAEWAAQNRLDFLALSFVRTADEVLSLKERLAEWQPKYEFKNPQAALAIPVIAKIEKPQALLNIDAIIKASDGIMVARGDLGVEMDPAQVPVAQKAIISRCRDWGKPVIVATQMLESMIESATPTRAEASDVANAVFDGADAVMLSGETAVGHDPQLVVDTMRRIVQVSEAWLDTVHHEPSPPTKLDELPHRSAALSHGVWHIAKELDARAVVVWSQHGGMAGYLSQHDFRIPIIACTSNETAARKMCLMGGVMPLPMTPPGSGTLAEWTEQIEAFVLDHGLARPGDSVIMIGGKPLGTVDAQDAIAVLRVGDPESGFRPR